MKRIAIIEDGYVRDAQIFAENPGIITEDSDEWEDNFRDVKYPCLYLGIYESVDEDEIRKIAAERQGCHPDIISLIDPGHKADYLETGEETIGTDGINKVFYRGCAIPLTPKQLAAEAGFNFVESDYPKRISGQLCVCPNGGEFDLFPKNHPAVIEGGKRYMRCWICGETSHL